MPVWHDGHHGAVESAIGPRTFAALARPMIRGACRAALSAKEISHDTRNIALAVGNLRPEFCDRHARAGAQSAAPAAGRPCPGWFPRLLGLRCEPPRPALSL